MIMVLRPITHHSLPLPPSLSAVARLVTRLDSHPEHLELLTTNKGTQTVLYLAGCRPLTRPELQSSMCQRCWCWCLCVGEAQSSVQSGSTVSSMAVHCSTRPVTRSELWALSPAQPLLPVNRPAGEPGLGLNQPFSHRKIFWKLIL